MSHRTMCQPSGVVHIDRLGLFDISMASELQEAVYFTA